MEDSDHLTADMMRHRRHSSVVSRDERQQQLQQLYNRAKAQHLKHFPLSQDVRCMEVVNSTVWVASRDGTIHIRDIQLGHKLYEVKATSMESRVTEKFQVKTIYKHDDSVWVGSSDGVVRVYDVKGKKLLYQLNDHTGGIQCITGTAQHVWSASEDFTIFQRHPMDGQVIKKLIGHSSFVHCMVVDKSNGYLWSGSKDGIRIWDPEHLRASEEEETAKIMRRLTARNQSKSLSAACDDIDSQCIKRLSDGHDGPVLSLIAVHNRVWSGGKDSFICVWDATTFELLKKFKAHKSWVQSMKQVDEYIWSASQEAIKVWDPLSSSCITNIKLETKGKVADIGYSSGRVWVGCRGPPSLHIFRVFSPNASAGVRKLMLRTETRRLATHRRMARAASLDKMLAPKPEEVLSTEVCPHCSQSVPVAIFDQHINPEEDLCPALQSTHSADITPPHSPRSPDHPTHSRTDSHASDISSAASTATTEDATRSASTSPGRHPKTPKTPASRLKKPTGRLKSPKAGNTSVSKRGSGIPTAATSSRRGTGKTSASTSSSSLATAGSAKAKSSPQAKSSRLTRPRTGSSRSRESTSKLPTASGGSKGPSAARASSRLLALSQPKRSTARSSTKGDGHDHLGSTLETMRRKVRNEDKDKMRRRRREEEKNNRDDSDNAALLKEIEELKKMAAKLEHDIEEEKLEKTMLIAKLEEVVAENQELHTTVDDLRNNITRLEKSMFDLDMVPSNEMGTLTIREDGKDIDLSKEDEEEEEDVGHHEEEEEEEVEEEEEEEEKEDHYHEEEEEEEEEDIHRDEEEEEEAEEDREQREEEEEEEAIIEQVLAEEEDDDDEIHGQEEIEIGGGNDDVGAEEEETW